jgi:hypothetical protein
MLFKLFDIYLLSNITGFLQMNRRKAIKNLIIFGSIGITSVSIYEWQIFNSPIDLNVLKKKKETIAELAELIIPRTDTPGAKDAKVEEYILKMIEFCTDVKTQNKFLTGLTDVEKYAVNNYNQVFIKCSNADKTSILKHFEEKSYYSINILNKANNKFLGKPFFACLKELTIYGYCTSQLGATKGLAYDFVPGSYQACIPLNKNQRSWATK